MRQPPARLRIRWLILAGTIVVLGGSDALACSGPGAARTIRESELIGSSFAILSIAIVAVGCIFLRRRSPGGRIRWIVAALVLHPRIWMDAVHGDCGFGLRFSSLVATLWIADAVALALCWPQPAEAGSKEGRWLLSGALVGVLIGLPIVALMLGSPGSMSAMDLTLVASVPCSTVIAGALVGGGLFRRRTRAGGRFRFSLRTLLLLPFVLAPLFVVLLPVLPYEASVSTTSPFRWVVVDEATGRPIPGATVRVIDPRFALNDLENQRQSVVTGADGSAEDFLYANVHGRKGLLGETETITYDPFLIRVVAPGYQIFYTALAEDPPVSLDRLTQRLRVDGLYPDWHLAEDPPISFDRLTARPLGLTFPPPPSVTIRLSRAAGADGADDPSGRHPPAP
jgi:hypothetical protein